MALDDSFNFIDTIDYKRIEELAKTHDVIQIGYVSGIPHIPGDEEAEITDLAEDARKLSYGADKIPARPFLEVGMTQGAKAIEDAIEYHLKSTVETGVKKLERTAEVCIGAVKELVFGDYFKSTVPNAQSTIDAKSTRQKNKGYLLSDKPLIDTGQMINSLTSVINGDKS